MELGLELRLELRRRLELELEAGGSYHSGSAAREAGMSSRQRAACR